MSNVASNHPAPGMTPKAALAEPPRHDRKAVRINLYAFLIALTLAYVAELLIEAAGRTPA